MMKIALVESVTGDWVALYVDGKLVRENHSLEVAEVLPLVGVPFSKYEWDAEINDCYDLPELLETALQDGSVTEA